MLILLSSMVLTVGAQGNLEVEGTAGIGTPALLYPLAIKAAPNNSSLQFRTAADGTSYHINTYADRLEFRQTGSSNRPLTINDGGTISIGAIKEKLSIAAAQTPILRFDREGFGYDAELRTSASYLTLFGGDNGTGAALQGRVKLGLVNADASLTTDGLLQLGLTTGENIVIDASEIMARNNGALSELFLQDGKVTIDTFGNIELGSVLNMEYTNGGVERNSFLFGNYSASFYNGISSKTNQFQIGLSKDPSVTGSDDQGFIFENLDGLSGGLESAFYALGDASAALGAPNLRWNVVYAANGTIQTSDMRLKKDIEHLAYGLETVRKMNPVSYRWKDGSMGDDKKIGFLAQEMEQLVPEAVTHHELMTDAEVSADSDQVVDPYGMNYSELIPVLTRSIQELADENDQLEVDNQSLRLRLDKVEALVATLTMIKK